MKIVGEAADWVRQTPEELQRWREKFRSDSAILLLLLVVPAAFASKPTARRKTGEERAGIEALRYSDKLPAREIEGRFGENLARDCESFAYGADDRDLTVQAVLETYPPALALRLLTRRASATCVRNVAVAGKGLVGRFPREVAAVAALRLKSWEGSSQGDHWPLVEVIELLKGDCGPASRLAFRAAYCRYQAEGLRQVDSARGNVNPFAAIPALAPKAADMAEEHRRQLSRALGELQFAFQKACPKPEEPEPTCK